MQTLIICGTPWCELQPLLAFLEPAGLRMARRTNTGGVQAIAQWHERLFADLPAPVAPIKPDAPWQLAAEEIFSVNRTQPAWGWADSRSSWLLDFWRDFDPGTRFVLTHTPASSVLCRAMADTELANFDSHAVLNTWSS